MATGDIVAILNPLAGPETSFAPLSGIAGGSSPNEELHYWPFDDATTEYADFLGWLGPNYDGGGLTLKILHTSDAETNASAEVAIVGAAIRRLDDDVTPITTSHTYDYNTASFPAPTAARQPIYDAITFTSGADMDSLAAGEAFLLRIERVGADGSDTYDGDWWLLDLVLLET